MKVFVDSKRPAPKGWSRVLNAAEAIECLKTELVTHLDIAEDRFAPAIVEWVKSQLPLGYHPPITVIRKNPVDEILKYP